MQQYGLIGYPLNHSFSPEYFNQKFASEKIDALYKSYPIASIKEIENLINQTQNLSGINVTIPYKSAVIPLLQGINKAAKEIGAVNCIKIIEGKLYGFNTDYLGFAESLKPLLRKDMSSALVLGTGGSSKAVCYALTQLAINYKLVSASGKGDLGYEEITDEIMKSHLLIINTTPLGMHPQIDNCPSIPYQFLNEQHVLYDLVYNPIETLFLQKGKQQNATVKNGLEMLHLQAEKSWEIWNDDEAIMDTIAIK